ncbi:hypothetical protein [Silvibacterium acidisoli]|uniref:hypothetical protein n=1 Tax=Acidobacteriaceae bacterium ZG23-2 TaxID=2883246 RepID=UPI00406D3DB9
MSARCCGRNEQHKAILHAAEWMKTLLCLRRNALPGFAWQVKIYAARFSAQK